MTDRGWIITREMLDADAYKQTDPWGWHKMAETHEHKFENWEPIPVADSKPTEQMSRCECGSISIKPLADK